MTHRIRSCLASALVLVPLAGCTRLDRQPDQWPELAAESLATMAFPAEWGNLVAVSADPRVDRLWFQNDSGEIRIAFFDHGANRIWAVARLIPRN